MEKRITESELVLPSLYFMYLKNSAISTSELIQLLSTLMKPVGKDAEILDNRKDTHFSQIVRNLKCHNKLEKKGYAVYKNKEYTITEKGIDFVKRQEDNLRYLFANSSGFSNDDIWNSLSALDDDTQGCSFHYDEIISEGERSLKLFNNVKRSQKLREAAIEHFTHNNVIKCDCCGFEFGSFYGPKYGMPCIEIHHLKPIFQYAGVNEEQTIANALKNLLPVCPNCHRVIHKNNITASMIDDFRLHIQRQSKPL